MHPTKFRRPHPKKRGIALLQLLGAILLIGIIVAIAIPLIGKAKATARDNAANAAVTMLNGAANRARLDGLSGAGTTGNDAPAALQWYKDNNLVPKEKNVDLSDIYYLSGSWKKSAFQQGDMNTAIANNTLTPDQKSEVIDRISSLTDAQIQTLLDNGVIHTTAWDDPSPSAIRNYTFLGDTGMQDWEAQSTLSTLQYLNSFVGSWLSASSLYGLTDPSSNTESWYPFLTQEDGTTAVNPLFFQQSVFYPPLDENSALYQNILSNITPPNANLTYDQVYNDANTAFQDPATLATFQPAIDQITTKNANLVAATDAAIAGVKDWNPTQSQLLAAATTPVYSYQNSQLKIDQTSGIMTGPDGNKYNVFISQTTYPNNPSANYTTYSLSGTVNGAGVYLSGQQYQTYGYLSKSSSTTLDTTGIKIGDTSNATGATYSSKTYYTTQSGGTPTTQIFDGGLASYWDILTTNDGQYAITNNPTITTSGGVTSAYGYDYGIKNTGNFKSYIQTLQNQYSAQHPQ